MDENHVMSTSILQFLEEFKTHMKNNVMHSIQNEAGLLSEYQPLNKDNDRGVLFESENADNFEFDNHEFLHEEQVKLFDSKVTTFINYIAQSKRRFIWWRGAERKWRIRRK